MEMRVHEQKNGQFDWDIKIDNVIEHITEVSFPIKQIQEMLARDFEELELFTLSDKGINDDADKAVYFVYRKRNENKRFNS